MAGVATSIEQITELLTTKGSGLCATVNSIRAMMKHVDARAQGYVYHEKIQELVKHGVTMATGHRKAVEYLFHHVYNVPTVQGVPVEIISLGAEQGTTPIEQGTETEEIPQEVFYTTAAKHTDRPGVAACNTPYLLKETGAAIRMLRIPAPALYGQKQQWETVGSKQWKEMYFQQWIEKGYIVLMDKAAQDAIDAEQPTLDLKEAPMARNTTKAKEAARVAVENATEKAVAETIQARDAFLSVDTEEEKELAAMQARIAELQAAKEARAEAARLAAEQARKEQELAERHARNEEARMARQAAKQANGNGHVANGVPLTSPILRSAELSVKADFLTALVQDRMALLQALSDHVVEVGYILPTSITHVPMHNAQPAIVRDVIADAWGDMLDDVPCNSNATDTPPAEPARRKGVQVFAGPLAKSKQPAAPAAQHTTTVHLGADSKPLAQGGMSEALAAKILQAARDGMSQNAIADKFRPEFSGLSRAMVSHLIQRARKAGRL